MLDGLAGGEVGDGEGVEEDGTATAEDVEGCNQLLVFRSKCNRGRAETRLSS
jgi:hypothetical protein